MAASSQPLSLQAIMLKSVFVQTQETYSLDAPVLHTGAAVSSSPTPPYKTSFQCPPSLSLRQSLPDPLPSVSFPRAPRYAAHWASPVAHVVDKNSSVANCVLLTDEQARLGSISRLLRCFARMPAKSLTSITPTITSSLRN